MSDNPFDLGPAAGPVDNSQFQAALQAWYADRDRIVNDVFPKVDGAIATVNEWSSVINNIIGLVQQFLPLVLGMIGNPAASATATELNSCNDSAVKIQQAMSYVKANLPDLVKNVPGLFDRIQNLKI